MPSLSSYFFIFCVRNPNQNACVAYHTVLLFCITRTAISKIRADLRNSTKKMIITKYVKRQSKEKKQSPRNVPSIEKKRIRNCGFASKMNFVLRLSLLHSIDTGSIHCYQKCRRCTPRYGRVARCNEKKWCARGGASNAKKNPRADVFQSYARA